MPAPEFINKGDVVSVIIAGKVFIMEVYGFFDGNRNLLYLLTPAGFTVTVPARDVRAIHGLNRNVTYLFNRNEPPSFQPSGESF